ncbi:unnamed protein product [Bursaphelenchus xylophilus]|uniref:(pine wood nematode) hypothetical protein n=1 Tax=Bursaphelenchus xylophilus TaxID=6326 RepID=A0A1I7S100_BURXY|nr:unnamed protein product [Bursaphelenchus xylophilus]CAG9087945.1 unnamed protein product [Bursaphelenchus xylophilus]
MDSTTGWAENVTVNTTAYDAFTVNTTVSDVFTVNTTVYDVFSTKGPLPRPTIDVGLKDLYVLQWYDLLFTVLLMFWTMAISIAFIKIYTMINGPPSIPYAQSTVTPLLAGEFDGPLDLLTYIALTAYIMKVKRRNEQIRRISGTRNATTPTEDTRNTINTV